jgi:hypothetical protein
MSKRERIVLGGLGGLAPVLVNIFVVDYNSVLVDANLGLAIGYVLKSIGLFGAGALMAYLHQEPAEPRVIFQLGMAAPAALIAALNGARIERANLNGPEPGDQPESLTLVSSLYAQAASQGDVAVGSWDAPRESFLNEVFRGITGFERNDRWFVIAAKASSLAQAKRLADSLQADSQRAKFPLTIFPPLDKPEYIVAIGAWLPYDEASELLYRATRSGFRPRDTTMHFARESGKEDT